MGPEKRVAYRPGEAQRTGDVLLAHEDAHRDLPGRDRAAGQIQEHGPLRLRVAFAAGVVHQVMAFVAPKLLGGRNAPSPIGGDGFRRIAKAMAVEEMEVTPLGDDVLLEGFVSL